MRWNRYEVIRYNPDSRIPYRQGAYPIRWVATWVAARRIQATLTAGDMRYEVREKEPAVRPGQWWYELNVLQSPRWHLIPSASVMAGSTVVHLSIGITRWHALGRACKWAKPRSRQNVRVSKWANEHTHVTEDASPANAAKTERA